jgi:recombination protein RecA
MARNPVKRQSTKKGARELSSLKQVQQAFAGFRPASEVLTEVRSVRTCFVQVDHALRVGGWPIERFTLIHGPSNHGKSLFAAGLVMSFLQQGGIALWLDAERTSPITWFRTLMGGHADSDCFYAQRPDTYEGVIADTRNFLNSIIRLKQEGKMARDRPAILVCDSLRKLVPRDMMKEILEAEKEATAADVKGGRDRSGQLRAKMNAAWMDELVPLLEKAGAVMVAIGREMQDPDADPMAKKWGTDYKIGGGGAIYFDSSIVARIERAGWVSHGEHKDKRIYGERHRVTIKKTKVAAKDDKVQVGYFHSSNGVLVPEGFDRARDVLELACRFGVVEKSGSSYWFEGGRIAAGAHQAVVQLTDSPDWLARIEQEVRGQLRSHKPAELNEHTGEVE